ncbi:acyl-homoserine-lactone synthase [Rhodovulum sp. YNF3179]|uniref:acyl-homoserine-lactone synthase n=1 Tax=Rhodovulum sp. YNF3179 TaxID=3425127 RepID=UPI003D333EC1
MLRYLRGSDLARYPKLRDGMFRDRARQFRDRLGWAVSVDAGGLERDGYDDLDPLYVIWQRHDGGHGGSMRFLPTDGPTMLDDHFAQLTGGRRIRSARVWECTRFCLAPGGRATPQVPAALMLAGAEIGLIFGLTHAVGVFDARMVRIYRRLGWPPQIFGQEGRGAAAISAGLWPFSVAIRDRLAQRAGISRALSALWCARAFGATDRPARSA